MIIAPSLVRIVLAGLLAASLLLTLPFSASATPSSRGQVNALPPGLTLAASPSLVDVGDDVTFTLHATSWPAPASAVLAFVSPHHGFTGPMLWVKSCTCFQLAVQLARRIHPIETALATATVTSRGVSTRVHTTFHIRGLAPNGRSFAPGGTPTLTGWVANPWPLQGESQHYCAWVKTADGLGTPGYPVSFAVHFTGQLQHWYAGLTGSTGIVCSHKSIGKAKINVKVYVDIYAGRMHTRTSFTPRRT